MWLRARFRRDPGEPGDEHDDVESTIAAYVLSASDSRESAAAAKHLEVCPSCRELARRLSRAAAAIPLAAEEVRPPDRLRARILSAATPPAGRDRASGQATNRDGGRRPRALETARRYAVPALVAALLLLAVATAGLVGWNLSLTRELGRQVAVNRQLAERNAQLNRVNEALNQGPQYHTLSGEGPMGSARGSIVAFKNQPVTVIYFSGLPAVERGKVYELWLTDTSGQRTRGPVFTPDASGTARIWLERNLNGITRVGVTQEQGPNGVDAPTQQSQLKTQIG